MSFYKQLFQKGALTGTLLFTGPCHQKKEQACSEIIRLLWGEKQLEKKDHPDLHHLYPEGRVHTAASIKSLIDKMPLPPYESPCKIFVIHHAELMLPVSSNALLKTLEEPPLDTLLILLSSQPDQLLPTIVSRCRVIRFDLPSTPQILPQLVSLLSEQRDHASFIKACDTIEQSFSEDAKQIDALYDQILFWYRDRHLLACGGARELLFHHDYMESLDKAKELPLPSLEEVFNRLNISRLGSHRHIRLQHVLEFFFLLV